MAGVMACALFAAVPGPARRRSSRSARSSCRRWSEQGFPKRFGAGVITTSGALGILIPPSIVMVMYAVATNTSVGQLFMAGIIPGIVLATMLGIVTWYRAWKNNYPRMPRASLARVLRRVPGQHLGTAADRHRHRRHLFGHVHPDRGGGDERRLRLRRRGVHLQGHALERRAEGAAGLGRT